MTSRDNLLRPSYGQVHFYTILYPVTCLDLLHSSVTLKMEAAGYSKRMANMHQSTGYHNPEAQNQIS